MRCYERSSQARQKAGLILLDAFTLGPLLIPTRPMAVVLSLLLAAWAARRYAAKFNVDADWASGVAEGTAWLGLLGARLGYVTINWSAFSAQPWTALYIWQPGYLLVTGIILGVAYALYRIWRRPTSQHHAALKVLVAAYASSAVVLGCVFLVLFAFAPENVLRRGNSVPNFSLVDVAGNTVEFASLEGRGVIINFWATWCPPCRREVPLLNSIHNEYGSRGLTVLGINLAESVNTVAPFVAEMQVSYPIWLDANPGQPARDRTRTVYERFGGVGLPTTIFIDRDGIVRDRYVGELNRAILQQRAEEILRRE